MYLTDQQLTEFGCTPEQIKRHRESELVSKRKVHAQCDALIDAGWKFELPSMPDIMEPWQWAWASSVSQAWRQRHEVRFHQPSLPTPEAAH